MRACHLSENEWQHSPDAMATQGIWLNRGADEWGSLISTVFWLRTAGGGRSRTEPIHIRRVCKPCMRNETIMKMIATAALTGNRSDARCYESLRQFSGYKCEEPNEARRSDMCCVLIQRTLQMSFHTVCVPPVLRTCAEITSYPKWDTNNGAQTKPTITLSTNQQPEKQVCLCSGVNINRSTYEISSAQPGPDFLWTINVHNIGNRFLIERSFFCSDGIKDSRLF